MSKWTSQDPLDEHVKVPNRDPPKLDTIAAEIFLKVIEFLHTARDLASISKTCRRFRGFVDRDGWRTFVQINFPSLILELPSGVENNSIEWRDLARSLTAQSRAWDRRAMSAIMLYPKYWATLVQYKGFKAQSSKRDGTDGLYQWGGVYKWVSTSKTLSPFRISGEEPVDQPQAQGARRHRPSFSRPQSTPFHPTIDTKLEFSGKLSSKKQTVVWSTGPEVFVQIRRSGSFLDKAEFDPFDHHSAYDEYSSRLNGLTVSHDEFRSGIDDVTSINLLEPSTEIRECSPGSVVVDFIVGRASGHIHRYSVSNTGPVRVVANTFHSFEKEGSLHRHSVRSTDINSKIRTSLLVACSDKVISLYKTEIEAHDVWPIIEFNIELDLPKSQAWTTKFSSDENLLLGLGQSSQPIHAYKATPTGLVLAEKFGVQHDISDLSELASNTVYAIEPVSGVSRSGGSSNGDVFLSGCYDGVCRLYDRRAATVPIHSFYDPVDSESAVYSLTSFGQERFLAGSASSIMKIFDFRNSSKVYRYIEGLPCSVNPPTPSPQDSKRIDYAEEFKSAHDSSVNCYHDFHTGSLRICQFHELSRMHLYRPNASIFLYGKPGPRSRHGSSQGKMPIFALSSPSPICPLVYVGTAGRVYELEISEINNAGDVMDPYFSAPAGAGFAKQVEELVMYQMDGTDSAQVMDVPAWLYRQEQGYRKINSHVNRNERLLDNRWD